MRGESNCSAECRRIPHILLSPAMPLALLLNGQLYYFAGMSTFGLKPSTLITGTYYAIIFVWAMAGLWFSKNDLRLTPRPADRFFIFFLAWVVLSLIMYGYDGWGRLLAFVPFFVVLPYIYGRMLNRQQTVDLMRMTIAMGLLMFLIVIGWLSFAVMAGHYDDRPGLFGYNHTVLLAGLLFGSVAVLLTSRVTQSIRTHSDRIAVAASYIALFPLLWALQFIAARGGLVAASLIIILMFGLASWMKAWKRIVLLIGLALFVGLSFKLLPDRQEHFFIRLVLDVQFNPMVPDVQFNPRVPDVQFNPRVNRVNKVCATLNDLQYHGKSGAVRKLLYHNAVLMFLEHPLMGIGAGGYGDNLCKDSRYFPHSTFLQAFSELGLLGGLCLVGFAASAIFPLRRMIIDSKPGTSYVVAWRLLAIIGFYIVTDQLYGNYVMAYPFFLLAGIAVALAGERKFAGAERIHG